MNEKKKNKATTAKRTDHDDVARRQLVTLFQKRSRSLLRKAQKISALCDAGVAFVAFAPSGLATEFSSGERMEDVLRQYVDLPAYQRYYNLKDVEEKLERINQLDHIIDGEENKLHYLSNQIHHLELQIKKSKVEIEILDANLREYEVDPEQQRTCGYTLPQLLWCERNLKQALQRVLDRKNSLLGNCSAPSRTQSVTHLQRSTVLEMDGRPEFDSPPPFSYGRNRLSRIASQCPNASQMILKLDPWISPYSSKVRNSMLRDMVDGFRRRRGNDNKQLGEPSYVHSMDETMNGTNKNPRLVPTVDPSNDVVEIPTSSSPFEIEQIEVVGRRGFCGTVNHQENENHSSKWDGFLLAENLNLDDLDIII